MVRSLKNTLTTNLGEPLVTPLEVLATLPEAMQILFPGTQDITSAQCCIEILIIGMRIKYYTLK